MKIHLVVVKGRPEGMEIPVPMPEFLIGRDESCHLRPSSDLVSKLHCVILQKGDEVIVRDLRSTNGTFVNDTRVRGEVRVNDGGQLRVGPLVFGIKIKAGVAPTIHQASADKPGSGVAGWLLDYNGTAAKQIGEMGSKTALKHELTRSGNDAAKDDTDVEENTASRPTTSSTKREGDATPASE